MNRWPDREAIGALHARTEAVARHLRLPLRGRVWRGETGNWLGAGVGSSIDFQDHRPYVPGDDPRYIDWQAYARSGHYTMKLFREEVSPRVDLAFDVSASMCLDKGERSLELFYFAVESALQSGASLRCHVVDGEGAKPWSIEMVRGHALPLAAATDRVTPALGRVPWRQGSLRVWVSDLLFPGAPEPFLASLVSAKGSGLILAPFSRGESHPDWEGNIEMCDCESGTRRLQYVSRELLGRYGEAYRRHFALWTEVARRHSVPVVRVAAEPDFHEALSADAVRSGAIEVVT